MAEAQQVKVIESSQGMFRLNMPQSAIARVDVVDIDLVLQTTSGERVILAGAAIDSTAEKPPSVMFSDGQVSTAQLFSTVAQVQSPAVPIPAMASLTEFEAQKTKGPRSFVTNGEPKGESASASADDVQPPSDVPTNVAPLSSPPPTTVETLLADAKKSLDGESSKHGDYTHAPVPIPPQSPPSPPPSSPGAQATVPQLPTLQVWFGNYSDSVTVGSTVYGAGGTAASDPRNFSSNSPLAANSSEQIAPEILTLTGNQTVYVDGVGPLLGTTGSVDANATSYYSKVFMARVVGTFNSAGSMTISGLPLGFSLVSLSAAFTVVNTVAATATSAGVWTVTITDTSQAITAFPLKLIYPTNASADLITLDFAESVYYSGANYDLHQKVVIQVKEVHSAADLNVTTTDPNDSTKTVSVDILPSNGVPNLVYAQGSHNTIYGGISDDTMVSLGAANTFDGGGGINTVDFSRDATSHTIDLTNSANNHGGYAEGSVLSHISVIRAGSGGDTITGNATTSTTIYGGAGNDVMAGGSAGDVFVGGGGRDTVTYAASASPVTVDQTGGGRALGDASGDTYSAISTIIGSGGADSFIGGTGAGSATMDGGLGSDWVDYQYVSVVNSRGVTVNLNDSTGNSGGAINDRLVNIENIQGSTGNDLFYASTAANSFIGNGGIDIVSYDGQSALTIDQKSGRGLGTGAASGDSYTGIATLIGTTGNDTFVGGTDAGSAVMDGALGNNWISYNYTGSSSVTVNLAAGTTSGAGSNDRFVNIENVYGSGGNDLFYADTHANTFIGGGGTDVVSYAGLAAVTVDQSAANRGTGAASGDSFSGIATIIGTSGNDTFFGGTAALATMDGGANATGGDWVSYAGEAAATVDLTQTSVNGGSAANNVLINIENVVGSSFADLFYADSAANSFVGGGGHDTVSYERDTSGGLTIDLTGQGYGTGYASGDSYSAISVAIGSSSSDTFIGGVVSGATMDGGGSVSDTGDWIDYEYVDVAFNRGVTVNLDTGINGGTITANAAANDRLVNIENVKGTSGNDLFYASSAANSFVGGAGTDVVSYAGQAAVTVDQSALHRGTGAASGDSYNGIETIIGTSGDDTFFGGTAAVAAMDGGTNAAGGDWVSYAGEAAATVDLTRTSANGGSAANNYLINIENIVGSTASDTFYANSSANSFVGGGGTGDVVSYARDSSGTLTIDLTGTAYSTGYASGDSYNGIATVIGSAGGDTFIGGIWSGVGTAIGGGGTDWVSYKNASSDATVNLAAGGNAGSAATNHLSGIENIIASDHGDWLTGDALANSFISGAGADTIDGGDGRDVVDYSSDLAAHVINLTTNTNSGGYAAGDSLVNIEVVIGGSLNDTLTGDATQSTTLFGGAGDDTLAGGTGADYFDGGIGNDVVTYAGGAAVKVNQGTTIPGGVATTGDQYVNIETIIGSSGNDTFFGGTSLGSATMDGGLGSDLIDYEYLAVGPGVTVNLASGVNGGAAAYDHFVNIENIRGSQNSDTFVASGSGGTISIDGGSGSDWISYAQNGGQSVTIDLYNQQSSGAASNDHLVNIENIIGSTASDTFFADSNDNSFSGGGGTGRDVVSYVYSAETLVIDQTAGGHGNGDLARGDSYSGIATIIGGSLSDTFIGGTSSGSATMDGGSGSANWASYQYATASATVNLATMANAGSAQNDRYVNVENIIASAYGDKLTGDIENNTFIAGAGADAFVGGGGTDVVSYKNSVVVDQVGNGNSRNNDAAGDTYSGIATIVGSSSSDTFIGGTGVGSATMDGGVGADWISYQYLTGGVGATIDLLNSSNNSGAAINDRTKSIENAIGSSYADLFYADDQTNSFLGGAGSDVVSYNGSGVGLTIDQTGGTNASGYARYDYYSSIETIVGSQYDDTFIGGTTAVLATMDGGANASGGDWISYQYYQGALGATVDLSNSVNNGGAALTDRQVNIENVLGTTLNDLFYASASANSFVGGGGTGDVVSYARDSSGTLTINLGGTAHSSGYASGDTYSGIATVIGSGGNDTFLGGTSATSAVMDGGANATGGDWVSYQYETTGAATVDLSNSAANAGVAAGNVLVNIENVKGTSLNDLFYASASANSFVGGGGTADIVSYANQSALTIDLVNGSKGSGFASGDTYSGIATVIGTGGSDTFIGGTWAGAGTASGGGGTDWISYESASGAVTVNLTYNGTSSLNGGAAATNHLIGIENIIGSTLDDTFVADSVANSFDGKAGSDWVSYALSASAVTVDLSQRTGSGGSAAGDYLTNIENIIGSGFDDTLIGDGGNNTFVGGAGADSFDGGSGGIDVVSYASSAANLSIDLTNNSHGSGDAAGDRFSRIASIIGTSGTDTFFSGTSAASVTLNGAAGTNWVSYEYATSGATVDLTRTSANGGSAATNYLVNIENVIGSSLGDTFFADSSANSFLGGAGSDWVNYKYATSAVTVNLVDAATNTGGAAGDYLTNIENIVGSTLSDTFFSSSSANSFVGGGGTGDVVSYAGQPALTIDLVNGSKGSGVASGDTYSGIATVIGSSGNDTFIGGAWSGVSTAIGGGGSDWISYQSAASGATVDLTRTVANSGSAAGNILYNIENIAGSSFSDMFYAGTNANSFVGNGGTDIVSYVRDTSGTLVLNLGGTTGATGYASGDTYSGIATVIGSTGSDTFIGGSWSGAGTASGGGGNDWISYKSATSAATVNLTYNGTASLNGGSAATNHLIGIENIIASDYGDSLTGDAQANSFVSGAGADKIDGGDGTDTVSYLSDPTSGIKHTINLANNALNSGGYAAGDVLTNIEVVYGGNNGDTITGNASRSTTIIGGNGADLFYGGSAADSFNGGTGTDTVSYDNNSGTSGLTINLANTANSSGYAQGDIYTNIEIVKGTGYADTFIGSTANGSATMDGGLGVGGDWIDYSALASGAGVTVNLASGTSSGAAAYDHFVNIENIAGSVNADVLTGSTVANVIKAGAGDDTIYGSGGSDTIDGGAGTHDIVDYSKDSTGAVNNRAVTVYLGGLDEKGDNAGSNGVTPPTGYTGYGLNKLDGGSTALIDYYVNVEDIRGGGGDDILIGSTGTNTIYGGAGDDTLGSDGGGDRLDGGTGNDTVTYGWESAGVTVYLGGTDQNGATISGLSLPTGYTGGGVYNGQTDYYANIENVTGSRGSDFIVGSSDNNTFIGNSGSDTIYGMAGNDSFIAGKGSEYLDGGDGTDRVDYSGFSGGVSVNLASHHASNIDGVAFADTLYNIENVYGTDDRDVLIGDSGNNTIWGGSGNDTLSGGGGSNVLYGGTDTDTVDYSLASGSVSVNLNTGIGTNIGGGTTFTDTLVDIEAISGSSHGDTISGNGTNWAIYGGSGNDTFNLSGIGTLDGGGGNDSLVYTGSSFSDLVQKVTNIESVDSRNHISGDGYTMTTQSIINILGTGGSHSLSFTIDSGDTFMMNTSGSQTYSYDAGTSTYSIYSDSSQTTQLAQLQLHQG